MKRIPLLTAIALATVFFVSCKNGGKSDLAIPKDAFLVLQINTSSLTSKLSWKEIKETNWFRDMAKDEQDSVTKKILENPETSGVDLKSDFAYFIRKQGTGGYGVFEGKIKDESAFESMVKNMKKDIEVKKDGDLKYANLSTAAVLTWNDNRFFVINDVPIFAQSNPFARRNYGNPNSSFSADSLRNFSKDLLSLKSDNSIEKDDRYSAMMKETGDLHVFVNGSDYLSSMGGGVLSMMKVNTLLEGNAATYTLNFDNGKITVKLKAYFGDEMAKVVDKFETRKISEAVINRIPSQDVIGYFATNMDPKGIREFLRASGFDGMANGYLGEMNYSLDELLAALKGEFVIAVTDVKMKKKDVTIPSYGEGTKPYTYSRTEPDMHVLFASSVSNRQSFQKLLNIVEEKMGALPKDKVSYKLSNDWFVASNDSSSVNGFIAGGNNKVPFADEISGHSTGMYVDLQKICRISATDAKNAYDSAQANASIATWQNIIGTTGEYNNKSVTAEYTINLVDKSTNSLKQLNQYAQKMSDAKKLRKNEYPEVMLNGTDSVMMTKPVTPVH
jgi:hypothetical protein